MQSNNFFHWAGEKLGAVIRLIVDSLSWLFHNIHGAIDSFTQGLTSALGISTSIFSIALLIVGLAMLYAAIQSLFRRRILGAIIWALLGLVLLSWLIS